jgi:hypothetical protein
MIKTIDEILLTLENWSIEYDEIARDVYHVVDTELFFCSSNYLVNGFMVFYYDLVECNNTLIDFRNNKDETSIFTINRSLLNESICKHQKVKKDRLLSHYTRALLSD